MEPGCGRHQEDRQQSRQGVVILDYIVGLMQLAAALVGLTLVSQGMKSGAFGGGLKRTFAGGATGSGVFAYLEGFDGTESFLRAASNGSLGWGGYLFLFSLVALAAVWIANLVTVRRVVV